MNDNIKSLQKFRAETHKLLNFSQDATFDLIDAVLTTRVANCLADFSLSPLFRRKWHSAYEALQDCRPNRQKLMKRYLQEIPTEESNYLT